MNRAPYVVIFTPSVVKLFFRLRALRITIFENLRGLSKFSCRTIPSPAGRSMLRPAFAPFAFFAVNSFFLLFFWLRLCRVVSFVVRSLLLSYLVQFTDNFGRHAPVDDVAGLDATGFLFRAAQRGVDEINNRVVRRSPGVAKRFDHLRHRQARFFFV